MLYRHLPSACVRQVIQTCPHPKRSRLLRSLGVSMGTESCIHAPFRTANCKPKNLSGFLTIGDNVYIGMDCLFDFKDRIEIGDRVTLAYRVNLLTHWDPGASAVKELKQPYHAPIKIGNDVYIGTNVCILPGVTLGDGCVGGAGAVVREDVPAHAFVGGVPASVIKMLKQPE